MKENHLTRSNEQKKARTRRWNLTQYFIKRTRLDVLIALGNTPVCRRHISISTPIPHQVLNIKWPIKYDY